MTKRKAGSAGRAQAIHTIDSLMAKTVEVGECCEWTGYFQNKTPSIYHAGQLVSVRRLMLELRGRAVRDDEYAVPGKCRNPRCIREEHIRVRTHAQHVKAIGGIVGPNEAVRRAKLTAYRRAFHAKLTIEKARAIRTSSASHVDEAKRHGVAVATIKRIRAGKAWKEVSTPFSGLGA